MWHLRTVRIMDYEVPSIVKSLIPKEEFQFSFNCSIAILLSLQQIISRHLWHLWHIPFISCHIFLNIAILGQICHIRKNITFMIIMRLPPPCLAILLFWWPFKFCLIIWRIICQEPIMTVMFIFIWFKKKSLDKTVHW